MITEKEEKIGREKKITKKKRKRKGGNKEERIRIPQKEEKIRKLPKRTPLTNEGRVKESQRMDVLY